MQNGVAAGKEESEEEPPQNGVAAVKEESEEEPPPPAPLFDGKEFYLWSFYRAIMAEFVATFLFLYVTVATVIGHANETNPCKRVGALGIAWSFGGMTFIVVYCTAGISGGHINPAITFGLFVARKVSLNRAVLYMVAQCLGAICGAGMVKAGSQKTYYSTGGGGELTSSVSEGFATGKAMTAEIIGTFVVVYIFLSATDSKNNARNAHIHILAPLAIGFAVFMVHLATIPVTGPGINPAKCFGTAVIYGHKKSWDDLWIFWVGPFTGATIAAAYHKYVITNTLFE